MIIFQCNKCIVISINNQQQFLSPWKNLTQPKVFMISMQQMQMSRFAANSQDHYIVLKILRVRGKLANKWVYFI